MSDTYLDRSAAVEAVDSLSASAPDFVNSSEIGRRFMEPEEKVTDKIFNRNLQMGNIRREDLEIIKAQFSNAMLIRSIPVDSGRFLFLDIGNHIINDINFGLAASNSVDGRGRASVISRIVRSFSKDETPKSGIGSMFGKKEGQ